MDSKSCDNEIKDLGLVIHKENDGSSLLIGYHSNYQQTENVNNNIEWYGTGLFHKLKLPKSGFVSNEVKKKVRKRGGTKKKLKVSCSIRIL